MYLSCPRLGVMPGPVLAMRACCKLCECPQAWPVAMSQFLLYPVSLEVVRIVHGRVVGRCSFTSSVWGTVRGPSCADFRCCLSGRVRHFNTSVLRAIVSVWSALSRAGNIGRRNGETQEFKLACGLYIRLLEDARNNADWLSEYMGLGTRCPALSCHALY